MLTRGNISKQENIEISTDNGENMMVALILFPDSNNLYVSIVFDEYFESITWLFEMDGYSCYFDIRHVITKMIDMAADIDEYIEMLDECFVINLMKF